jgi:hypothetical protein
MIIKTTARIRPRINRVQATLIAVPAIPMKPSTPTTRATMRKVTV